MTKLAMNFDQHANLVAALSTAEVGSRVTFEGERMPYTVQARNDRYIICTKPFAPRKTVIYSIVDMVDMVRGPDNMIFGRGYESREDCQERLSELIAPYDPTDISYRNRVSLRIARVRKCSTDYQSDIVRGGGE